MEWLERIAGKASVLVAGCNAEIADRATALSGAIYFPTLVELLAALDMYPAQSVDAIILCGGTPDECAKASEKLRPDGLLSMPASVPVPRGLQLDVQVAGRAWLKRAAAVPPLVYVLCPSSATGVVANFLAMSEMQFYPPDYRRTIVLSDSLPPQGSFGNVGPVDRADLPWRPSERWRVLAPPFDATDGERLNYLLDLTPDAKYYLFAECRDLYLPWHVATVAMSMESSGLAWCKSSLAWTDESIGEPAMPPYQVEAEAGSLLSDLAVRGDLMRELRVWSPQLLADALSKRSEPAEPCYLGTLPVPPSRVRRVTWKPQGTDVMTTTMPTLDEYAASAMNFFYRWCSHLMPGKR